MAVNGHDSDAPSEGADAAVPPHTAHDVQESYAHELDYGNSTSSWFFIGTIYRDFLSFQVAQIAIGPFVNGVAVATAIISPGNGFGSVILHQSFDGVISQPSPVTFRYNTPIAAGRYTAQIDLPQINVPLNVFVFSIGIISEDLSTYIELTPSDIISAAVANIQYRIITLDSVALFGNGTRFFPQFTYFDLRGVILGGLDFVRFGMHS